MDERIRCCTTEETIEKNALYFPFTQGGLCAQLPHDILSSLKDFACKIQDFTLRLARPEDELHLPFLLHSYGNSLQNYEDLEQFQEEKLPVIIHNLAYCFQHRYFLTFLLLKHSEPIAFFQVDSYDKETMVNRFQQKFFPEWGKFFQKTLSWEGLRILSFEERQQWLDDNVDDAGWNRFCQQHSIDITGKRWLGFINGSIQTVFFLEKFLKEKRWIGNLSYNLLPSYQGKGLMSCVLQTVEPLLKKIGCVLLFSDRVAKENKASIRFLQRKGFSKGGDFVAYYGSAYQTRHHPQGNFAESCVSFYKVL